LVALIPDLVLLPMLLIKSSMKLKPLEDRLSLITIASNLEKKSSKQPSMPTEKSMLSSIMPESLGMFPSKK
jgi:hypothetical protein